MISTEIAANLTLTALMLAVIWWDVRAYIIPNKLNLLLLLLFPLWAFVVLPEPDWLSSALMFAVLLVAGFGLFALRTLGAGDVKLLAVLGLYTGWGKAGAALVIYMSLLGGAMALLLLLLRALLPKLTTRPLPRLLQKKQPVPYGLAIAGSFLILIWTGALTG